MEQKQTETRPSVLLVDDDEPFRNRLARALRERGYDVRTAGEYDTADRLVKADNQTGDGLIWQEPAAYVGEPIFVPSPGGSAEDDGLTDRCGRADREGASRRRH